MALMSMIKGASGGGTEDVKLTSFVSVGGGTVPVFTTDGTAKKIYMANMNAGASQNQNNYYTNVNPNTGEIDNTYIWYSLDGVTWNPTDQSWDFVVTNGQITLTNRISAYALLACIIYTT